MINYRRHPQETLLKKPPEARRVFRARSVAESAPAVAPTAAALKVQTALVSRIQVLLPVAWLVAAILFLDCRLGLLLNAADPARAGAAEVQNLPGTIPDPTAQDWFVDRFAGNSTAGPEFFQGPAREVGGLGRCGACPLPDGRVLVPFRGGVAEIGTDGILRLLTGGSGGFVAGTTAQVTAGTLAYNPRDKSVYAGGPNCIYQITEKVDGPWSFDLMAGIPGHPGFQDGPAKEATFTRIDNILINTRGTVFILDYNERIRQIENGRVSTLNTNVRSGRFVNGPLAEACFNLIGLGGNLCLGDDDDTLYLSDHWNFATRQINLKAMTVTTVAGMPQPAQRDQKQQTPQEKRYNSNSDGPALTWASFNSGCAYVCWDPVHKALWVGGPDESRFRWLKDGEVRTVIGAKGSDQWSKDALAAPAETVKLVWNAVVAVDPQGRAYLSASSDPNGLWRASNRKEMKP